MEAAAESFARHGFDGTSLAEVISASNTSKGTLYHHFEGKEDLYATVLETMLERMWRATFSETDLERATRDTFWKLVTESWHHSARYMVARPEDMRLWRGFQEQWRSLGDAGPTRRLRQRSLAMGERLSRLGQSLGCVRDDLSPTQCAELVESLDMVTDAWFFEEADAHGVAAAFRRQAPLTMNLIWRLLAPPDVLSDGHPSPHDAAPWPEDFT